MNKDDYARLLGRLVANLHSLEFALRVFLLQYHCTREPSVDIRNLAQGEKVGINSFTSYESLRDLIRRFNKVIVAEGLETRLDSSIVNTRDLLAHGRVYHETMDAPARLLKFGPPSANEVLVEQATLLDEAWLTAETKRAGSLVGTVMDASRDLGQESLRWVE